MFNYFNLLLIFFDNQILCIFLIDFTNNIFCVSRKCQSDWIIKLNEY